MKTKLLAFTLAIILLGSLLAACGESSANTTNDRTVARDSSEPTESDKQTVKDPETSSAAKESAKKETASETEPKTEPVTEAEPEPEPAILSEGCDMIVATGKNGSDYYELVVNQVDAFPQSKFEFGVIKNNEWIVEMSENCPFLDDNNRWKGLSSSDANQVSEKRFIYLDEGCFLYTWASADDYNKYKNIIYKPDTGVFFEEVAVTEDYSSYDYKFVVTDGLALARCSSTGLSILNMNTGEATKVGGFFADNRTSIFRLVGLHEGLFWAESAGYSGYNAIFDTAGNMVLDLTEYNITNEYDYDQFIYKDGKMTVTCKNDSDVNFDITFNNKGEIISSVKSKKQ